MKTLAAFCVAAICAGLVFSAPASAQNRRTSCNDEWSKMKADNTVGDKKYRDFFKECMARTAAPVEAPAKPAQTAPAAVFPSAVSSKYSNEKPGRARMHTCADQYRENKANNANGGLRFIEKGGYWPQCNAKLKG
jgi:hypothetical protein